MAETSLTHGIKLKDKIGYALGDMGGLLTFSLIGAFQNKFYTDALGLDPKKIIVLIFGMRLMTRCGAPLSNRANPARAGSLDRGFWAFPFRLPSVRC